MMASDRAAASRNAEAPTSPPAAMPSVSHARDVPSFRPRVDTSRQIARGRPFAADGGEQSIETVVLAVVDEFGAAAGAIGVARAVIDQRAQARIEIFDLVAASCAPGRCLLMKARKSAMSPSLTPTSSGLPANAVSVVPSSVWPRQGRTKKCPLCGRHGQRASRVIAGTRTWMPFERISLCDAGLPSACSRKMSAHGPAATSVAFARMSNDVAS